MAKATTASKPNVFARMVDYLGGVRTELRRVVWPTRNEVLNSSMVVIVALAFFVLFTFVVDSASVFLIRVIGRIGG